MKEKYINERAGKKGVAYRVNIPYYDDRGRQTWYSKTFPSWKYSSRREALKAAVADRNEALHRLDTVGLIKEKKYTVAEVFEMCMNETALSVSTQKKHRTVFNRYIAPEYGDCILSSISTGDIEVCLNRLVNTKSNDVIGATASVWREIFTKALKKEIVYRNPCATITVPKSHIIEEHRQKVTDIFSFELVMNWLRTPKNNAGTTFNDELIALACEIMFYTGIRPGEAFGLHREDVDLERMTFTIRRSIGSNTEEEWVEVDPKTKESARTIPISDELLPTFRRLFDLQDSDEERLFTSYNGQIMSSDKSSSRITYVAKICGVKFNMYMLRHMMSDYLDGVASDKTIQSIFGHKYYSQSLGYMSPNEARMREALNNRHLHPQNDDENKHTA